MYVLFLMLFVVVSLIKISNSFVKSKNGQFMPCYFSARSATFEPVLLSGILIFAGNPDKSVF